MRPDTRVPTIKDPRVELAARKIVELINSRPMSPRQDEIADIIKSVAVDATPRAEIDPLDREYGPVIT